MKTLFTTQELVDEMKRILNNGQAQLDESGVSLEREMKSNSPIESAKVLNDLTKKIKTSISGYVCGLMGENNAYEATRFIPETVALRNIQTPGADPNFTYEHDLILISKKGIFDCEVKYISAPYAKITEQGTLESRYADGRKRIHSKVAQQARAHRSSIYHLLKNTKYNDVRITPMILCANDNCTIKNEFEHIKTCYCNNAEYVVIDEHNSDCLTDEDIRKISEILKAADSKYEPRRYPLPITEEEYNEAIGNFINEYKQTYSVTKRIGKVFMHIALKKLNEFFNY